MPNHAYGLYGDRQKTVRQYTWLSVLLLVHFLLLAYFSTDFLNLANKWHKWTTYYIGGDAYLPWATLLWGYYQFVTAYSLAVATAIITACQVIPVPAVTKGKTKTKAQSSFLDMCSQGQMDVTSTPNWPEALNGPPTYSAIAINIEDRDQKQLQELGDNVADLDIIQYSLNDIHSKFADLISILSRTGAMLWWWGFAIALYGMQPFMMNDSSPETHWLKIPVCLWYAILFTFLVLTYSQR